MTDQVLYMASFNLEANFAERNMWDLRRRFRLRPVRWGDAELIAATDPPFDLILANDAEEHRLRRGGGRREAGCILC